MVIDQDQCTSWLSLVQWLRAAARRRCMTRKDNMIGAMVARLLAAARQAPAINATDRGTTAKVRPLAAPAIFSAIRHTPVTQATGLIGLARQAPIACDRSHP